MDGLAKLTVGRRRGAWAPAGVMALGLVLGVPSLASAQEEPKSGGTLVFARNQEPLSLNPIGAADNGGIFIINQVCDGLVQVGDSPTPVPGLAESWESSPDGLTWTFKLREATFSNGDPVTAEDVKFSLDRWADDTINLSYGGLSSAVDTVTIVDPSTIQITLSRPDGGFLDALAMFVASIVPESVVEEMGDEAFGQAPVCAGPFKVTDWETGVAIDLARNEHYWGSPTYLDGVRFEYIPDDNTRLLKIENDEADVVEDVPYAQVERVDALDGVTVQSEPVMKWDAIWLNTTIPPLDEVGVRQALNYATPKQEILDNILAGSGTIANHIIARVKYWDESVPAYPYDLDKARELMAASSVPDGFQLQLLTVAGDSVEQLQAEAIKEAWAEIGVDVQIEQVDANTAFTRWIFTWPNVDMAATFPGSALSSDTLSDDNLVFVFMDPDAGLHSFGTGWGNPEVVDLLHQATSTFDEDQRATLFPQAQALAMADAPAVPLFFTDARTAIADDVKGFKTYPTGWWNLDEVWLDR